MSVRNPNQLFVRAVMRAPETGMLYVDKLSDDSSTIKGSASKHRLPIESKLAGSDGLRGDSYAGWSFTFCECYGHEQLAT
jgi:hypothetical protein